MQTSKQILANMRADRCLTASRSRSKKKHNNFSNKYTQLLGELGYAGIKKNGYFTKFYSYGVVGHCCIFVQYHLIKAGYQNCVPKKGYIWNTGKYAAWLKTQPTIKGLGKVDWTTDIKKAQQAVKAGKFVIVFKAAKGHGWSHACSLLDIQNGYIRTVDGNVKGTYKGKKINNGVEKKRKASKYKWGFAIMPIPVTATPAKPAVKKTVAKPKTTTAKPASPYTTYILLETMNVRNKPTTKGSKVVSHRKKGEKIRVKKIETKKNGAKWGQLDSDCWICIKGAKGKKHAKKA